MGSRIAGILEILGDGRWHGIEELQQQANIDHYEMQKIAAFLSKYDLAMVDNANKKVKINRDFQKLLAQPSLK